MGDLKYADTLTPLPWAEAVRLSPYVREHGVKQFLSVHRYVGKRRNDRLLWGDEVEYILVKLDATRRTARLSLRSPALLRQLTQMEEERGREDRDYEECAWHPEYGAFMVES